MAPSAEDAANALPEAAVLEKWMMGTAKEADTSAAFLRRLLRMNPAYAQYLTRDEDLGGIVQLFAKRFRHIIVGAETPIQLSSLYKPICELTWRIVGLVLSSIMELTEKQESLPVPKEAQGQVKMLLQTNIELSNKLSELRRAYLRELTNHRDKQRNLNEKTLKVIASLQEYPIMFYEPLEFVLDETTKDFVRDCVEERVKLEMRTCFSDEEANKEVKFHMEDLEQQLKKKEHECRKSIAGALKTEQRAKQAEVEVKSVKEELERRKTMFEQKVVQFEELEAEVIPLKQELSQAKRRVTFLEETSGKDVEDPGAAALAEVNSQMQAQLEQMKVMKEKLAAQEQEKQAQAEELAAVASQAEQLKVQLTNSVPGDSVHTITQERVVEKIVYVDNPGLQEQLEKTMTVESELRGANDALVVQLEEEQKEVRRLTVAIQTMAQEQDVLKKQAVKKEPKQTVVKKEFEKVIDQGQLDEEVSKAVDEVSKKFEKETKEKDTAIEKLKAELDSAKKALQEAVLDVGEKKKRKTKKTPNEDDNKENDELAKLRENYDAIMDEHEDLQHEYKKLEDKVAQLVEKLKEVGGKEVVEETLARIKITAPKPTKKKKKKAFERLYDDAQRRIIDQRVKAARLERAQERVLVDASAKVVDKKSFAAVKALAHLQRAATATNERFSEAVNNFQSHQEAVNNFQSQHADSSSLGLDYSLPGHGNTTIPEDSVPEWFMGGSQSEGWTPVVDNQSPVVDNRSPVVVNRGDVGSYGGRGRSEVRSGVQPHSRFTITQDHSGSPHPDVDGAMANANARFTQRAYPASDWQACPSCGNGVPPNAKFCGECGFRLGQPSQAPVHPMTNADPALNPYQARDLSPSMSPWRQAQGGSPLDTTPNKRPNRGLGGVGVGLREPPSGSPTVSPQKRSSLGSSGNLQPMLLRHSAGEADLRFSGHRMSVSGGDDPAKLPPAVFDGPQASSLHHGIDTSFAPQSVQSPSSRRFVRLGAETLLGHIPKNLPTPESPSRLSFNTYPPESPSRPRFSTYPPSMEAAPSRIGANSTSPSPMMHRTLGAHDVSFEVQASSSGGHRRPTGGRNYKDKPTLNNPYGNSSRSTPDLTVSSRQLHTTKENSWDPLSRGRHHSRVEKSPFSMRSAPVLVQP